jgi:hypothetical protein
VVVQRHVPAGDTGGYGIPVGKIVQPSSDFGSKFVTSNHCCQLKGETGICAHHLLFADAPFCRSYPKEKYAKST